MIYRGQSMVRPSAERKLQGVISKIIKRCG